jgi:hypothetical protein
MVAPLSEIDNLLEMLKKRWIDEDLKEREQEFKDMVKNIQLHRPDSPINLSDKEVDEAIDALKEIRDGKYPTCSQKAIYALEDLDLVFQPVQEPPILNAKKVLSEKHYKELMALVESKKGSKAMIFKEFHK